MRQAVMTAPGRIELRDVDAPRAGPGQVLLRIKRIGVCGSDVHVWHGRHPYTSYPVVQGHEFAGVIEAVGPGVRNLRPGQKATAMPQLVCGQCPPCRRGQHHICDQLKVEGFQAPGCAQELFVVPAERVVPLPEDFTFEQGAMVEPAAVAVHAVGRAGGVESRRIAVVGAGPIGNLIAQVSRAGGGQVVISDRSRCRLLFAEQCKLLEVCDASCESLAKAGRKAFGAEGFDLAFEAVGSGEALAEIVRSIQKGGTIIVVGVYGEKPVVDMGLVQDRELTLRGSLMYQRADYQEAIRLIQQRLIVLEPLQTAHYPLEQMAAAYEHLDRDRDRTMKVFIDV